MTTKCEAEGCSASHPDHRWGKTRAHAAGWFEQRDGKSWCPDHVPAWVAAWRAKRGSK